MSRSPESSGAISLRRAARPRVSRDGCFGSMLGQARRRRAVAKVLLIEDEEATRLLVRAALEAAGIEVLEAADGQVGLDLARSAQPDLILLDVGLPVVDGWQVAH